MSDFGDMMKVGAGIVGSVALAFTIATTAVVYPALDHETEVDVTDAQHEVLKEKGNGVSYDGLEAHLAEAANQYFGKNGYKCGEKPAPNSTAEKVVSILKYWDDNSTCKKSAP